MYICTLLLLTAVNPISSDIESMFYLHNQVRKEHNKPILGLSETLCGVAQDYANLLVRNGQFRHNVNGRIFQRLDSVGYEYTKCGENLAQASIIDDTSQQEIMNMWMKSLGHRANILGPFQEIGLGQSGNIWVVVFATPKNNSRTHYQWPQ